MKAKGEEDHNGGEMKRTSKMKGTIMNGGARARIATTGESTSKMKTTMGVEQEQDDSHERRVKMLRCGFRLDQSGGASLCTWMAYKSCSNSREPFGLK